MKLYKGTGCHIKLVGILKEIPRLHMDDQGDFFTTIGINVDTPNKDLTKQYQVAVVKEAALRLRQYGFPGLYLLIEGGFHTHKNSTHIIAEKIIFLDTTEPNPSRVENHFIGEQKTAKNASRELLLH